MSYRVEGCQLGSYRAGCCPIALNREHISSILQLSGVLCGLVGFAEHSRRLYVCSSSSCLLPLLRERVYVREHSEQQREKELRVSDREASNCADSFTLCPSYSTYYILRDLTEGCHSQPFSIVSLRTLHYFLVRSCMYHSFIAVIWTESSHEASLV